MNTDCDVDNEKKHIRWCQEDKLLEQASVNARKAFKIFWREMSWVSLWTCLYLRTALFIDSFHIFS
jgi:hypothetical protein